MTIRLLACAVLSAGLAWSDSATAQVTDTLARIRALNTVTIGYREASVPFSFLDGQQRPIGYSLDLCNKIVDAIRANLNLPNLEVRHRPVTAASRIPLIANGTVDMECGATTNTAERQQQVAFVVTTFVAATRLAWQRRSNFTRLEDLRGRPVVGVAGTTNLRQLSEANTRRGLGISVTPARQHDDAFAMLARGDAAAFVSDDILLFGIIANAPRPADYVVSAEALSVEPYGIMIRRNDPAFKELADNAIRAVFASGEIQTIYARWFTSPIPPRSVSLNAAMSPALARVIATPTDSARPSDYEAP